MTSDERPRLDDRVRAERLPGGLGTVIDYQHAHRGSPERWLVRPERAGELPLWLTRREFELVSRPNP